MGKINVLDKHVAELIAAGEVVERPSSVIKELVENSIDAGADAITVEIQNGGTTLMRVFDNGSGIMRDDVRVAFLRNATSKVKNENDLLSISTLGFRGEALASICAVSKLTLITKSREEEVGTSYEICGGEEVSLEDAGCPNGTTFIIRDLFYNIPARMKFLKKDVSEGNAVSNVMDKIALSHPEISFTFIKDGKQVLKTAGDNKLLSAIYSVYGRDFTNSLIPVDYTLNGVHVYGYISRPVNARPNRNMQNFFINSRFVKSRTAMAALEEASKGTVMVGKFPSCVLNIDLSFEAVDVNVHPSKIEVRFINERPIFDAVYHAVKTAILSTDQKKQAVFSLQNKTAVKVDTKNAVNPFMMADSRLKEEKNPTKNDGDLFSFIDKQAVSKKSDGFKINPPKSTDSVKLSVSKDILISHDEPGMKFSDSVNPLDIYKKQSSKQTVEQAIKLSTELSDDKLQHTFDSKKSATYLNADKSIDINPEESEFYVPELVNDSKTFTVNSPDEKTKLNNTDVFEPTEEESLSEAILPLIEQPKTAVKYIGEAFKTYIITEMNDDLVFIDKHAAHERIIFEKLKKEKGSGSVQMLLEPVTVVLNKIDYDNVLSNLDVFKDSGFDIDDFGNGTLLVRCAPQYLENEDIEQTVTEMAGYLGESKRDIRTEKMEWIYHNIACRAAVKAGNKNCDEELMNIAKAVYEDRTLNFCPHGRPVCLVFKKSEIEKQFGRV